MIDELSTQGVAKNSTAKDNNERLISVVELYNRSWARFTGNWVRLVVLSFITIITLFVFQFIIKNLDKLDSMMLTLTGVLAALLLLIIGIGLMYVAQAGLMEMIKRNDVNFTVKMALLEGSGKAWQYFLVGITAGIFTLLWFLLFVIPGIWAAINYSLAMWVFIIEGLQGTAALKRSKELVKGHWWGVVGRMLALYIPVLAVIILPSAFLGSQSAVEAYSWVIDIAIYAFLPFFYIYSYYLYKDLSGKKGATKIENKSNKGIIVAALVLFMLIIGIIAALFIGSLNFARKKARTAHTITNIKTLQTGLEEYKKENESYPNELSDMDIRLDDLSDASGNEYKYIRKGFSDYELCFNMEVNLDKYSVGYNCVSP